jgi:phage-related protein
MASMKIADAWDKNGKPTHYLQLSPDKFEEAAKNLTNSFSVFVTELGKAFSKIDRKARKNMKKLSGPITEIIKGVAALIEPLMQIASGKMQVGNEVVSVDLNKILEASNGIVNIITSIFGPLNELVEKDIKHRKIKKLFKTFRKSMEQLIKLFKYTNKVKIPIDDSILTKLDFLTRGGDIIIKFLNQNFEDAYSNAKIFKKALKPFRKSVKSLFELFKYATEIGIPIDDKYIQTITTLRTGLVKILALL